MESSEKKLISHLDKSVEKSEEKLISRLDEMKSVIDHLDKNQKSVDPKAHKEEEKAASES